MKKKLLRFILLLLILIVIGAVNFFLYRSFTKVSIEGKGDFTLLAVVGQSSQYPSWFVFDGPGDYTGTVRAHNLTEDKVIHLDLYSADYMPTDVGDFGLEMNYDEKNNVGAWIQLEKSSVDLKPGRWENIAFTIHIPEGLPADGLYAGGILGQKSEPSRDQPGLNIQTRVGSRIYINYVGKKNPLLEKIEQQKALEEPSKL